MTSTPTRSDRGRRQDDEWADFVRELGRAALPFDEHWRRFHEIFRDRPESDGPPLVWQPTVAHVRNSNIGQLMTRRSLTTYDDLYHWSIDDQVGFWGEIIENLEIAFVTPPSAVIDQSHGAKDPRWLPDATLNCVDSCFLAGKDDVAVLSCCEEATGSERVTYGDLERLTNRVANGLRQQGFVTGDRIALYMPMTVECVAAYLGTIRAGCCAVSIADSFSPGEVAKRLAISEASGIITVDAYTRAAKTIRLFDKVKAAGAPRAVVVAPKRGTQSTLRDGDLWWTDLLAGSEAGQSAVGAPDRAVTILFSSGTTGAPKAIPWSHVTPIKCAMDGFLHQDIQRSDVVAWPTNIGWMMGPWLIFATLINRATMALYEGAPHGSGFAQFVRDARVTILGVIPSIVRAWRAKNLLGESALTEIRVLSSTGEASARQDYLWLMSRANYQAPVIEYLGGTEIGGSHLTGTVVQPASPSTFTTAALGTKTVVLDENAAPVAEGHAGELYLVPPAIGMSQHLLNADHEGVYYDGCPPGPNGEVLRRHGDHLRRLHGGFWSAAGRSDDTMNLGGVKIASLELEQVIDGHEAVFESAAVGVQPEGDGAEVLVVYVVLARAYDTAQLKAELGGRLSTQINPLFKISDLLVRDTLPRTASNKLTRRVLRDQYSRQP